LAANFIVSMKIRLRACAKNISLQVSLMVRLSVRLKVFLACFVMRLQLGNIFLKTCVGVKRMLIARGAYRRRCSTPQPPQCSRT